MSLEWARGCNVDVANGLITGGPYPDDTEAWITRLYGPHPAYASGFHYGLDSVPWKTGGQWWLYPAGLGCPLVALGYGDVYWRVDNDPSFGNAIGIQYGAHKVQYFHMRDPSLLAVGDRVVPGQEVGYVGTTGFSTGPHLHIAVYVDDYIQDPLQFLIECNDLGYVPQEPYVQVEAPLEMRLELPSRVVYVGYDPDRWTHSYEVRIGGRTQKGAHQATGAPYGDGDEEVWPFEVQDWG